jgi:hypothetical protein
MGAAAFKWNQGEFEFSITRQTISNKVALTLGAGYNTLLQSDSLSLPSLNTLVQPLSVCDCKFVAMIEICSNTIIILKWLLEKSYSIQTFLFVHICDLKRAFLRAVRNVSFGKI